MRSIVGSALDRSSCARAQWQGACFSSFCPFSQILPRFHRKDLQHQRTLKQTKKLDNNTAKGLTNINKGVRLSTKQHSSHCVFDGYSSYSHVILDPNKLENTTLTSVLGAFTYYHMSSRSCNAPTIKSLAEDCKLSAWGWQPFVPFNFYCHLIWFSYVVVVFVVFFRKTTYSSSLGEHSPTLHPTYTTHLVLYPDTLGTMCHFSLGVG